MVQNNPSYQRATYVANLLLPSKGSKITLKVKNPKYHASCLDPFSQKGSISMTTPYPLASNSQSQPLELLHVFFSYFLA